jgi:cysteine desulfurase
MADLGADLLTLSAHKIGGPQGVGALVVTEAVDIAARIVGGAQELRRRAGTENTIGIAGFATALDCVSDDLARAAQWRGLRDRFEARLLNNPGVAILGAGAERVANTICVAMPGVASETQVIALDLDGVAISAGAACSSGKVGPSHVLAAMGVDRVLADCAIRVSFGWQTKESDLERFFESWWSLYRRTRGADSSVGRPAA